MIRSIPSTAVALAATIMLSGCVGTASPPADPAMTRVVALDDFAAIAALTLGVTPEVTLDAFGYETSAAILDAADAPTQEYGSELDVERIAALDPDVIIGVSIPTTVAVQAQLEAIAATTILGYTDSWQDQLADTGRALGRSDEAAEVTQRVEADLVAVAGEITDAGLDGSLASVVGDLGGTFSPPAGTGVGSILTAAGLSRPAAQQTPTEADSPFILFGEEALPEHDGDEVFLLSGGAYATSGLVGSPLWSSLSAVQADAVHEVSGEAWLSTSGFATAWVVDDLRRVLVRGEEAKSAAAAAQEFERFMTSAEVSE